MAESKLADEGSCEIGKRRKIVNEHKIIPTEVSEITGWSEDNNEAGTSGIIRETTTDRKNLPSSVSAATCQIGSQNIHDNNKRNVELRIEKRHRDRRNNKIPRPEPQERRCNFYVERKRRYCKAIHANDKKFCVEHSHLLGDESIKKRIPCPLDPKHTCYEDKLQSHLRKCNSRDTLRPIYYTENINSGDDSGVPDTTTYKIGIHDIEDEEILKFVEKVKWLHKKYVKPVREEILFHPVLHNEANNPQSGPAAQKHIQQQASLLGHMKKMNLLENECTYLEFGAGRGGLSHWIQLAMPEYEKNKYMLIEKSSVRYKKDSYHRREDQGPSFERLRIDIQHLDLGKVDALKNTENSIVASGKHLCGGATDLMLRCLMSTTPSIKLTSRLKGVVLAFCCHHRVDWKSYVGKSFIHECELGARDLHLLSSMSSWATCGTAHVEEKQDTSTETEGGQHDDQSCTTAYSHPRYGKLLPQDRERIGIFCKQLIDQGRIHYLEKHGYQAKMVAYVDKKYSLENIALLATADNHSADS